MIQEPQTYALAIAAVFVIACLAIFFAKRPKRTRPFPSFEHQVAPPPPPNNEVYIPLSEYNAFVNYMRTSLGFQYWQTGQIVDEATLRTCWANYCTTKQRREEEI